MAILDTRSFDEFEDTRGHMLSLYDEILKDYESTVTQLLMNWEGYGAEEFESDAKRLQNNLINLQDIIKNMYDTLVDCREIFNEFDGKLGMANREAI